MFAFLLLGLIWIIVFYVTAPRCPQRFDIVSFYVLVVEIESVLPHVKKQKRNAGRSQVALVVVKRGGS